MTGEPVTVVCPCACAPEVARLREQVEALIATTNTHTELLDRDGERLDELEERA